MAPTVGAGIVRCRYTMGIETWVGIASDNNKHNNNNMNINNNGNWQAHVGINNKHQREASSSEKPSRVPIRQ
jgi:hypothetical protein